MLFSKFSKTVIALALKIFACIAFQATAAEAPKQTPTKTNTNPDNNPPYNFHGEVDKTDIFAIPVDNDEQSDEELLQKLDRGWPPKDQTK